MELESLSDRLVVVAGMSRAGTTFLYHNLQLHPDIFVPARKETAYFAYNYDEGLDWFEGFYGDLENEKVALDICGVYFMDENSIERLRDFNPDMRVIIGVRHPVDWVYSMYGHYESKFSVPPFREFLNHCTIHREGKQYDMEFANGKVQRTIERFADAFGDRLLVYNFNILEHDGLSLLKQIETFCGIAPFFANGKFVDAKINVRGTGRNAVTSRLMNRVPGLATFVSRAVPRQLIMKLRRQREVASTNRPDQQTADAQLSESDRSYAEHLLKDDVAYFERLFSNSPFVPGSDVRRLTRADG